MAGNAWRVLQNLEAKGKGRVSDSFPDPYLIPTLTQPEEAGTLPEELAFPHPTGHGEQGPPCAPVPLQSPEWPGLLPVYPGREASSRFQYLFLPKQSCLSQTWALPTNMSRPGTPAPVVFRLERTQG